MNLHTGHPRRGLPGTTRWIEHDGQIRHLSDWSRHLHIPLDTLSLRIKRWGVHRAFTTPFPDRHDKVLTHNGESLPVREWAQRLGMPRNRIDMRLKAGWSVARALDPTKRKRPSKKQLLANASEVARFCVGCKRRACDGEVCVEYLERFGTDEPVLYQESCGRPEVPLFEIRDWMEAKRAIDRAVTRICGKWDYGNSFMYGYDEAGE